MYIPNLERNKSRRLKRRFFSVQECKTQETNESAGEDECRTTFLIPPIPGSSSPNPKYHPKIYDLNSYVIQQQFKPSHPTICRSYRGYFLSEELGIETNVHVKVVDEAINNIRFSTAPPITHRSITPEIYIKCKNPRLAFVIMPRMTLGSARDLLALFPQGIPECFIGLMLKEVLLALKALHSQGYFHKDLKPSNILITDFPQPMIQLSASYYVPSPSSLHPMEKDTPPYHLPRELQNHHQKTFYSQAHSYKFNISDIWSVGVTALELAYGQPPISEDVPSYSLYNRVDRTENANKPHTLSGHFKEFVAFCLTENPHDRPLASDLLKLPFFNPENIGSIQEFVTTVAELKVARQKRTVVRWAFDSESLKLQPAFTHDCVASSSQGQQ